MARRPALIRFVLALAMLPAWTACGGPGDREPAAGSADSAHATTPAAAETAASASPTSAAAAPRHPDPTRPQTGPAFLDPAQEATAPRPRIRPRVLADVRTGAHESFDRVVFEFAGDTLPGYHVGYGRGPVIACGSGDEVHVAGGAALRVRMDPARAHAGYEPTIRDRRRDTDMETLRELVLTCDFEGQVAWALGTAGQVPFRVLTLSGPARLVVDVRHIR